MKTKFRTLAAVAVLFIFGFSNINATANYKRAMILENAVESESSLSLEEWMINDDYWTPKTETVIVDSESPLQVESWMTNENLWK